MTPYRPSILRLQEEFAARLARGRLLAKRGKATREKRLEDNSVPWMENPDSIADYLEISARIKENETLWLSRLKPSSDG